MELHVVIDGDKDLAGQLYRQLRDSIRAGRLAAGEKLPPSRLLAEQLGLSRKTVSEAYARLTFDRLLVGRVGSGTFVAATARPAPPPAASLSFAGAAVAERWRRMDTPLRHPAPAGHSRYEYIGGAPARSLFPHAEWRRCVLHALREGARSRGLYGPVEGMPVLREAIARHAAFARGVRCGVDDVIVTNGAQQALDLVARVLVEPGSRVAVEEPGYPPARLLFGAQGPEVVGIPVDAEGMEVERIPDGTRLVYVTPAHQFPLGMPMSRAAATGAAGRAPEAIGAIVIEDDYDSEFRYEGRAARLAAEHGPPWQRGLRRHLLQEPVARTAPGLPDRAARHPAGGLHRQAPERLAHGHAGPVGAGQVHRRRRSPQAHPPLPRRLCRAARAHHAAPRRRPVAVVRRGAGDRGHPHGGALPNSRSTWTPC